MSAFVTYAQNFEDLMLWRALRDVTEGFYIDVGAADPDDDSVTRAFYDRGWRGINIEPTPEYFEVLVAARPRDLTLRCLAGAKSGEAALYHFANTGLSTMDADFEARHVAEGRASEEIHLPVRTLAEICREHAPSDIHFLKIDVEGAEADVLSGADFNAFRPWIVLVEATEPGSQKENWQNWEGLLTKAEYRFVWFDGLNRFYLAAERWEALRSAFATPPNVFDQWLQPRGPQQHALLRHSQAVANTALGEANAARAALAAAQAEWNALEIKLQQELARAEHARERIEIWSNAILSSTSWRFTAPIRRIFSLTRSMAVLTQSVCNTGRQERLRRVAGPAPLGVKSIARVGLYGLGRLALRTPGGLPASALARRLLPGSYNWLHTRYRAYLSSAEGVHFVQKTAWPSNLGVNTSEESGNVMMSSLLPIEECRMIIRLDARNHIA